VDQLGVASLLLVAGIDTTWSTLGTSWWWLAQHTQARQRLIDDPTLWPSPVEELLRRFAPVSVVRLVTKDVSIDGQIIPGDQHVLLAFPAGTLDEQAFPEPYTLQLDQATNRHLAFGAGVHRCIGAHLARMELRVGLEEFLRAIPDFELDGDDPVSWKPGQMCGPSRLLLRWGR
jgi:cytochrome P450